jgi:hypothetical protein
MKKLPEDLFDPRRVAAWLQARPWWAETQTLAMMRRNGVLPAWAPIPTRRPPVRLTVRPGHCPVCGGETFRLGAWWTAAGPSRNGACWHSCCVRAWKLWTSPRAEVRALLRRQHFVCPETGIMLGPAHSGRRPRATEVDHVVPLWRVREEREIHPWPAILRFWGLSNLQALSTEGHAAKTAREAAARARRTS